MSLINNDAALHQTVTVEIIMAGASMEIEAEITYRLDPGRSTKPGDPDEPDLEILAIYFHKGRTMARFPVEYLTDPVVEELETHILENYP